MTVSSVPQRSQGRYHVGVSPVVATVEVGGGIRNRWIAGGRMGRFEKLALVIALDSTLRPLEGSRCASRSHRASQCADL